MNEIKSKEKYLRITISDMQDISQLITVVIDLCKEPPTNIVLSQINKRVKKIKSITNKYNNPQCQ